MKTMTELLMNKGFDLKNNPIENLTTLSKVIDEDKYIGVQWIDPNDKVFFYEDCNDFIELKGIKTVKQLNEFYKFITNESFL